MNGHASKDNAEAFGIQADHAGARESSLKYSRREVGKLEYRKEPAYFLNFTESWDVEKYPAIWAVGNAELLKAELTALFCSRKCPGRIVLKSRDFADMLRIKGTPVIGGFQTPVEKMCLEVLLKGTQPVVICPARGIQKMRMPAEWAEPVEEGRVLIVSPLMSRQRRATKLTAELRNRFVAAAADRLFFLHAAAKSKTLALAEELLLQGRDVFTFDMNENGNLKSIGASCGSVA